MCEFEIQSCYYVNFRINTLGKDTNLFIPLVMGITVSLLFF